jgi:hypothetical protein
MTSQMKLKDADIPEETAFRRALNSLKAEPGPGKSGKSR